MRIFVTGATGILGRKLVPELIAHGHDVIGLARSDASRSMLVAMHATAYTDQGYDIDRLAEAMEAVHAIVHLATGLPNSEAAIEDDWPHSSRIVLGMLKHLIEASERNGVRTIIFPSFYGVYAEHGAEWVTEDSSIQPDSASNSYLEAEQLLYDATAARRSSAVILRMGQIYSPEAPHIKGLLYAIANGFAATSPAPDAYWPLIHVEDAAQAIRLALELSPSGEIINVGDDAPIEKAQLYRDIARWIGAQEPPERARTGTLNPYLGRLDASTLHKSVRLSNGKAREMLGFAPKFPTHREGFQEIIQSWHARSQNA